MQIHTSTSVFWFCESILYRSKYLTRFSTCFKSEMMKWSVEIGKPENSRIYMCIFAHWETVKWMQTFKCIYSLECDAVRDLKLSPMKTERQRKREEREKKRQNCCIKNSFFFVYFWSHSISSTILCVVSSSPIFFT